MADALSGLPQLPSNTASAADLAYQAALRAQAAKAASTPAPVVPQAPAPLGASGFPVAQPGLGGSVAGLWQQALAVNGSQAGVPQPQPISPRMMGTVDPTAAFPTFTAGTGSPSGFGSASAIPPPILPTPAVAPAAAPIDAGVPLPVGNGVSPTPGAGNPLPPNMQDGTVPLPGNGTAGNSPYAAGRLAGSNAITAPVGGYTPAGGAPAAGDNGAFEVIRGGNSTMMGGNGNPVANLGAPPVRGAGMVDPSGAINYGYDRQQARADSNIDNALAYIQGGGNIFERATRARAITGIYNATLGPNTQGQSQTAGAIGLNNDFGGVTQSNIAAGASTENEQVAASTALAGQQTAAATARYSEDQTPRPIGTKLTPDAALGGIGVPTPVYGIPKRDANNQVIPGQYVPISNAMPAAQAAPAATPIKGSTITKDGVNYIHNGTQWVKQ